MNKIKVSLEVPAFISDFSDTVSLSDNKYVTPAKLKIFSVGLTGDKRRFTQDFADKLLKTLVHTPVVGYYDEEKEDFLGHNKEQNIYGFVPGNASITYEEEKTDFGTKKWAVTDVLLFTGRKDSVGNIASKIIGKQHSLELDPDSVQYNIVVDEKGQMREVVFTDASFIGLSVLGENQKPAFSGSHFFLSDEVAQAIEEMKHFTISGGSENMNELMNIVLSSPAEFNNLTEEQRTAVREHFLATAGEESSAICEAFYSAYPDYTGWVIDFVAGFTGVITCNYEKNSYEVFYYANGAFSEGGTVVRRYLTAQEVNTLEGSNASFAGCKDDEKDKAEEIDEDDDKEDKDDRDEDEDDKKEDYTETTVETPEAAETFEANEDTTNEADDNRTPEADEKGETNDGEQTAFTETQKSETSDTVFTDTLSSEEREELNNYRNQEKKEIVAKYAKHLTQEEHDKFNAEVGNYTKEELIAALSVAAMQSVLSKEDDTPAAPVFGLNAVFNKQTTVTTSSSTAELVNQYK